MPAKTQRGERQAPKVLKVEAVPRAVLYARVSSEEQRERQTIESQVVFAEEYCQREGLVLEDIYRDEAVSGTTSFESRPEAKRLLEDAKDGRFGLVLIYKVDRLGRADLVTHVALHRLETLGVGLRSMTEPFDTSTPQGRFMYGILASFAQLERDNIRERSMMGTNRVMKLGKWSGGIVPYGYRCGPDGCLIESEEPIPGMTLSEADVIRLIFEWATGRASTITIASRLHEMGIQPRYILDGRLVRKGKRKVNTTGKWAPARIAYLLHSTTYMGQHTYGKRSNNERRELIHRQVPHLVTEDIWHRAQEALRLNHIGAKRNSKRDYLLRGLVRCDFCGRSMTGVNTQGKRFYYRCNATIKHLSIDPVPCNARHVPALWIEDLVWSELEDWILHYTDLEEVISGALREQDNKRKELRPTLERMKLDISNKVEERDRIIKAYRQGILTSEDLKQQVTAIEQEQEQLEDAVSDLEGRLDQHVELDSAVAIIREQLDQFREQIRRGESSVGVKRRIVEMFVKEVRIHLTKGTKVNAVLRETIPYRPGDVNDSDPTESVEVWKRDDKTCNVGEGKEENKKETIQILYKFPFPPKPGELVSIASHTDYPA